MTEHGPPAVPPTHASPLPSLVIYDDPHSLFCSKLKAALYAKGVPFTAKLLPCGGTSGAEYRRVVPLGKIPALLVTEPGEAQPALLMETEVIIEWLEDRFPAPEYPALFPSHPLAKAQARILSRFHDLYFEPALRKLYPQVAPAKRDPATVEAAVKEMQGRLEELTKLVERADELTRGTTGTAARPGGATDSALPFGSFSLADTGFPFAWYYADLILAAITPSSRGLDYPPRLRAWKEALDAHPHVQRVYEELKPGAEHWLQSKLATTA